MEQKISKDEIAAKLWGVGRTYDGLSPWGQQKVDHIHQSMYPAPANATLPVADNLRVENLRLASQLEQARIENLELWDENTNLKQEIEELRASFNRPSL